ncbi:hypothetical protein RND71_021997 [Anisodus tanguticus]|uniref:Histidine-containing phosphotransfer protein n=1 Tax=Anisodus tanguticus TaxID=243964 RepID=A0AAE1V7T7_9SOLA|nr:hypothetical protein RND71_021997 [Anisodus tanguticus]
MDKSALKQQQFDRIKSLEDEGLVDCYFRLSYSMKEDHGPSFFLDLVLNFLHDARTVMQHMATALESPVVNFDVLNGHCIKLKGGSSCIGACKIAKECYVFIRAIDNKSKDGCLQALRNIKREYHDLQSKLESVIQLEKEIVTAESSKS